MPEYRAYIVGEDGHFIGYEPMVCANDSEATEKARRLSSRSPVELWGGPHMVTRIAQASTEPVAHQMRHGRIGSEAPEHPK